MIKIDRVPIDAIHLDPANARKHSNKNLLAIKGSINKFKQVEPLVVQKSTGIIIAGNGRYEVMKELGFKEVDVHYVDVDNLTATAMGIALNRTSELSEWDEDGLEVLLQELHEENFDLSEIGFELDDLVKFDVSNPEKDAIEDDVPEVQEKDVWVKRGDLFQLGEHRLLCGDSTNKEDVERLMNGEKADMVFTDPPYGMDLDSDFSDMDHKNGITEHGTFAKSKNYKKIIDDDKEFNPQFLLDIFNYVKEIFLFGADYYAQNIPKRNEGSFIVWDKRVTESMTRIYGSCFELAWSKAKHKREICYLTWSGIYGLVGDDKGTRLHPTQKPIRLAEWFFDKWGKDKINIVDLYLGSGSTLIACEKTNRRCFGMEIDPHYCQAILERWAKYSGKKWEKI